MVSYCPELLEHVTAHYIDRYNGGPWLSKVERRCHLVQVEVAQETPFCTATRSADRSVHYRRVSDATVRSAALGCSSAVRAL